MSWQHGTHSVKFGASIAPSIPTFNTSPMGAGALSFNDSTAAPASGYALADVLLGYPTSTPRIILLRREFTAVLKGPIFLSWMIGKLRTTSPSTMDFVGSTTRPTRTRTIRFHPSIWSPDKLILPGQTASPAIFTGTTLENSIRGWGSPTSRFGDAKTVIRGGAGIFNENLVTFNGITSLLINPPMRAPATYTSSVAAGYPE